MDLQRVSEYLQSQAEITQKAKKGRTAVIKGACTFFHYLCDGVDDKGWGCGYRTLQTLCSFCHHHGNHVCHPIDETMMKVDHDKSTTGEGESPRVFKSDCRPQRSPVPDIKTIQTILVKTGDKMPNFVDSRDWIGTFEAAVILDELFNVPCRILHAPNGLDSVTNLLAQLVSHFDEEGSPVMIGGDKDGASKTMIGISHCKELPTESSFLIADPHYTGGTEDPALIVQEGHVQWKKFECVFDRESFYNFCLPLVTRMSGW